jgi:hypothetical protein
VKTLTITDSDNEHSKIAAYANRLGLSVDYRDESEGKTYAIHRDTGTGQPFSLALLSIQKTPRECMAFFEGYRIATNVAAPRSMEDALRSLEPAS